MSTKVILPISYFPDPDVGRPISNASIYIGVVDLDPEIPGNQIEVTAHEEDGTSNPIAQPITTGSGGVPLLNGSPVKLTVESDYSIKVLDSLGTQKYYTSSVTVPIVASDVVYDGAASGSTATTVQEAIDDLYADYPIGVILLYAGAFASIPANWHLCDGGAGTPNLTDKFVRGTNVEGVVGSEGGSADSVVVAHTHTGTVGGAASHDHELHIEGGGNNGFGLSINDSNWHLDDTYIDPASDAGSDLTIDSAGGDGTDENIPPYYALAYIMKVAV